MNWMYNPWIIGRCNLFTAKDQHRKPIVDFATDERRYPCARQASQATGVSVGSIRRDCQKGKRFWGKVRFGYDRQEI